MPYIKANTHPREIFKIMADAEAEIEHCQHYKKPTLPKYQKVVKLKNNIGWWNFFRQLKP